MAFIPLVSLSCFGIFGTIRQNCGDSALPYGGAANTTGQCAPLAAAWYFRLDLGGKLYGTFVTSGGGGAVFELARGHGGGDCANTVSRTGRRRTNNLG